MKFWITRDALSLGILSADADETTIHDTVFWWKVPGLLTQYLYEGKDWHRTLEGAKERAETMRAAKIASLKKQIAKLEKLTF